jgi:tetratricopeptide (TPR) repeat protein
LLAGVLLIRRGGRGTPILRLAGFGILWFFLTLTVESSIIPIIDLMFEHRVYLPFAGICMTVAVGVALAATRTARPGLVYGAAAVLIGALAVTTFIRNEVWRTPVSLWQDATVKAPTSSRSWNNLAYAYLREKNPAAALPALIRAIELNPGPPDAWNNVGIALEQLGRYQGRFQRDYNLFRSAADLMKSQTAWFANAYNNLGLAYEYLQQPAAALQSYQKALSFRADFPQAHFNLGLTALMLNNRPLAEAQYQQLLPLDPDFAAELGRRLGY